ncbi:MAG: FAD-binding oxidoreductase [Chloroflexota bacterium]|nr:MAG: FAD-binding oxidoreductase [Chloroflexota bacterium]
MDQQNVIICGAGIAGISTAYHLAVRHGLKDVLLVDERPPMSLTSDKSTECYRNWWPGPDDAMVKLMNRSIDLLENLAQSTGNAFHLNQRGYLYLTGEEGKIPSMLKSAREISSLGAGSLRIYKDNETQIPYSPAEPEIFQHSPGGADLILNQDQLFNHFPYITEKAVAALHIRRAGWFSAQQLGRILLEQAKHHGVQLIQNRITSIEIRRGRVESVQLENCDRIQTQHFVNAAGPFINQVVENLDIHLPTYCELHQKVSIPDRLKAVPREAPLLIWDDPQKLPWTEAEREFLAEDKNARWLLDEFPPGVHTRPEGPEDSPIILMLWEYHTERVDPIWPPPLDKDYPEIALRGLATMIPQLTRYFKKPPRPFLDGGYYTKTRENRPLIGPLPIDGSWIIGALSGFGLMSALAAGELLAFHILGKSLPAYAPAFELSRYNEPQYLDMISEWEDSGQL